VCCKDLRPSLAPRYPEACPRPGRDLGVLVLVQEVEAPAVPEAEEAPDAANG